MLKALAFIVQEEHEGGANNVDEEYEVAPDNVDEEDEGAADNVDEEDEEAADNVEEDEGAADNVDEEQKLYEGATVNNLQAVVLILAFSLRHSLSDRATGDLLQLVQAFLPAGTCVTMFKSFFKFKQYIPKTEKPAEFVFYCPNVNCGSVLPSSNNDDNDAIDGNNGLCELCLTPCNSEQLKKDGCFFLMLSIARQISTILNVNGQYLRHFNVRDAALYAEVLPLRQNNNISITWNVDGVPLFKSSLNEVWPIRCIINELPPLLARKNIFMAGLYFGKGKPNMSSFMKCFVQRIEKVNDDGVHWVHPCNLQNIVSRVFPIISSCDSVARCMVQCIHQYNGAFGCSWCTQKGERVEKGNGHVNTYPLVNTELRTHEGIVDCGRRVIADESLTHVMGVKSVSPLILLHKFGFDMVRSFSVDYMHCVLLGVVRQFIELWTDSKYHESQWYLNADKIRIVDKKLLAIKPPGDIKRFPRNLKLASKWKASELRSFLIFYSVYVLTDVLQSTYLKHWQLLVHAVYHLLRENNTDQILTLCQQMLNKFVKDTKVLYGIQHMSYNVHQISHLVQCVRDCGPLYQSSAFAFENNNQLILRLFSGKTYVAEQIARNFMLLIDVKEFEKSAVCSRDRLSNAIVQKCTNNWLHQLSTSVLYASDNNAVAVGRYQENRLTERELNMVRQFSPHFSSTGLYYHRVIMNQRAFCTETYGKFLKTNSYNVLLKNNFIVMIVAFIFDRLTNEMFIICKLYEKNNSQLLTNNNVLLQSHYYIVSLTETIIAIRPSDVVSKVVFLGNFKDRNRSKRFVVSLQPNTVECD